MPNQRVTILCIISTSTSLLPLFPNNETSAKKKKKLYVFYARNNFSNHAPKKKKKKDWGARPLLSIAYANCYDVQIINNLFQSASDNTKGWKIDLLFEI